MDVLIDRVELEELLSLARFGLFDALRSYSDDDLNYGYMSSYHDYMSSYHDYRKHLHELIAMVSDLVYGA